MIASWLREDRAQLLGNGQGLQMTAGDMAAYDGDCRFSLDASLFGTGKRNFLRSKDIRSRQTAADQARLFI
jgi:hypothetical protein